MALSTSLSSASPAIKPDSDVLGAVRRALASWARVTNIKFVEFNSMSSRLVPTAGGDGVNLITIAATGDNLALFAEGNTTARTRVFYDPDTGEISEADIVINPYPYSEAATALQFSTDGTPGTYDLESTLAHEIGHLLGLSHSHVIGATMQASQALNGTYGLPAITERTLSEADQAAVRSLYGPARKNWLDRRKNSWQHWRQSRCRPLPRTFGSKTSKRQSHGEWSDFVKREVQL